MIVCGGRDYQGHGTLFSALDTLHAKRGIALVIHGGAKGADYLAALWARDRGIPALSFPAEWTTYGKRAGPIRNQQMIDEGKPDGVVAFPGRTGTADMTARARRAGLKIWEPCAK